MWCVKRCTCKSNWFSILWKKNVLLWLRLQGRSKCQLKYTPRVRVSILCRLMALIVTVVRCQLCRTRIPLTSMVLRPVVYLMQNVWNTMLDCVMTWQKNEQELGWKSIGKQVRWNTAGFHKSYVVKEVNVGHRIQNASEAGSGFTLCTLAAEGCNRLLTSVYWLGIHRVCYTFTAYC